MKIRGFIYIIIIFTLLISLTNAFSQETPQVKKIGLVVYPFKDETGHQLGPAITDSIIMVLSELGRFRVVERSYLETVLKEQELSLSGMTDMANALRVGKIVGAKKMITGRVMYANVTPKKRKVEKKEKVKVIGVPVATVTKEGEEIYGFFGRVTISLNLIDLETSEIVKSVSVQGTSDINEVNKDLAMQQAIENLMNDIPGIVRKYFQLKFTIAAVDGSTVYTPVGENVGLKDGYRFRVYKTGEPIIDYRGNIIKYRKDKVGEIKIKEVYADSGEAKILFGDIQPGDTAEEWVVNEITTSFYFGLIPFKLAKNNNNIKLQNSTSNTIQFDIEDTKSLFGIGLGVEFQKWDPFFTQFNFTFGFGSNFYDFDFSFGVGYMLRILGGYFSLSPSVEGGIMFLTGKVGTVGNNGMDVPGSYIDPGTDVRISTLSAGISPGCKAQINLTETVSLKINGYYRLYLPKEKWDLEAQNSDGEKETISNSNNNVGKLDLSGLYISVGIGWFF